MRKEKRGLGVDRNGVRKMMQQTCYLADMSGQFAGSGSHLIGQLTYFYTDKVGLAVGGIGIGNADRKDCRCSDGSVVWKYNRSLQRWK